MLNTFRQGYASLGWGVAIPDAIVTSAAIEKRMGLDAGWIARRTGIVSRPIAPPHLATSDLAVSAGEDALSSSAVDLDDIRLLILATSTPDYLLPPTAPSVAYQLGLTRAGAIDVAGACSGFLYGLAFADSFCRLHGGSALIIGANILSRRLNWQDPTTASLFSDGAGAVIWGPVARDAGIVSVQLNADASDFAQVSVPEGGTRNPFGPNTFTRDGHLMKMNAGPRLFRKAVAAMVDVGRCVLAKADLNSEDIDVWIPHQANQRLIVEVGRQLAIPKEKTLNKVAELGNSSAATIPIVWARDAQARKTEPGQRILLTAVGAGLIAAGMVIRH